MRGRSAAIAVDQALYALSNFALQLAVLRASSVPELAAFSVSYATYWLITGTGRALFGESQLVLRAKGRDLSATVPPLRWLVLFGLLGLVAGLATAWAVRGAGVLVASAMALAAPVAVAVDYVRYALIAREATARLVYLDATWLVVQGAAFIAAFAIGSAEPHVLVLCWTGGAVVAAALFSWSVVPRHQHAQWDSRTGRGMAGEFLVTSGLQQALPGVLYSLGFVQPLAALRAAQTVVSPLNTVFTAATTIFYGRLGRGRRGPLSLGAQLAAVLVVSAVLYGAVLWLLPNTALTAIFGDTVLVGLVILVPILCQVAANGVMAGGILPGRLLRSPSDNLRFRVLTAPLLLVAPVAGVYIGGAQGLAWGLFVGSAVTALIWWTAARRDIDQEVA